MPIFVNVDICLPLPLCLEECRPHPVDLQLLIESRDKKKLVKFWNSGRCVRSPLALLSVALWRKCVADSVTISVPGKNTEMLSFANTTFEPLHFLEMHLSLVERQYWGNNYALCSSPRVFNDHSSRVREKPKGNGSSGLTRSSEVIGTL